MRRAAAALAGLSLVGGCGADPGPVLDGPRPVPYADTLPIREPEERSYDEMVHLLREAVRDEVGSTISVRRLVSGTPEALNVGPFDEVVSSAWYEHRVTAPGGLTPDEVRRGAPGAPPASGGPLTVVDAKVGGVSPGFTVEDAEGRRYLLKFDPPGYPGLASGADVVSSRLFWAAGYHVPADFVFDLERERLRVAPDATVEEGGEERAMTREDVDRVLARADVGSDGRVRTLASLFLEGTPKGPFRFEGTRGDDPNDYFPHEHRRELRGLWVLAAWLNHVDLRFQNTLDMFVEPTGYLRHHLIDFGATLGSGSIRVLNPREGREYAFDLWPVLGRALTLGAYRVGWEGEDGTPIHPSLGWIAVERFDPAAWKPFWPNEALRRVTPADGYWGAKRVAALDSTRVAAAVSAARYADPAAADTLLEILLLRRELTLRHWFAVVTPVEEVRASVEGGDGVGVGEGSAPLLELSFRDLGLEEDLWAVAETRYRWSLEALDGATLPSLGGEEQAGSGTMRRIRIPLDPDGWGRGGWTAALELTALRPGASARSARVHLRASGEGSDLAVEVLRLRH